MSAALRLILADQLSFNLASLADANPAKDIIVMAEVRSEATYVKHHKKKIILLFSAMRHFAAALKERGFQVEYTEYTAADNPGSLAAVIQCAAKHFQPAKIILTEPGEYRVLQDMQTWESLTGIPVEIRPDSRFFCSTTEFQNWAGKNKGARMEYFYRHMRQRTGLLMSGSAPEGGQWNYDHDNRHKLPNGIAIPPQLATPPDALTQEVIELVKAEFVDHFGEAEPFNYAITHAEAARHFQNFLRERLSHFGAYQDAMQQDEAFLFHSVISLYLNCGLLDAREVCAAAQAAYHADAAPLNAVEGFIRQILGWREFMRGVYWRDMPQAATANALQATRPLPWFYWSGETAMNCLAQAIGASKQHAYAHHIQRLMVTGNFALIAGLDPVQVQEWYLVVYADAYEWVELPNVNSMALFADDGKYTSKPYAASGKYIDRMSDYCKHCVYDPKLTIGPKACPFNALYWDFIARHEVKWLRNQRMSLMVKSWQRMGHEKQQAIRAQAASFLASLSPAAD